MAAGDMAEWRRQNSIATLIEVVLVDGTELRGTMLVSRDKGLRELLSEPDPFVEIECRVNGSMLLAKTSLRYVRAVAMPKADQLESRLRTVEKLNAYGVLKLPRNADPAAVRTAADQVLQLYDPARAAAAGMPSEVVEYFAAMSRRAQLACTEIGDLLAAHGADRPAA